MKHLAGICKERKSRNIHQIHKHKVLDLRSGSGSKESAWNPRDQDLIPGLGTSPGEGNGYWLQYSCLENFTDRGTWQAMAHSIAQSDMTEWLSTHARLGILNLYSQYDPHNSTVYQCCFIFIGKKITRLKELPHLRSKSHNEDWNAGLSDTNLYPFFYTTLNHNRLQTDCALHSSLKCSFSRRTKN